LALAWCLSQGDDIIPIPGTKRIQYLRENVQAVNVTLSAAERQAIGEAIPKGVASGERYVASQMQRVGR
jgi:aryl-alcohol dehydrogenase-like predicted oxidoreductase